MLWARQDNTPIVCCAAARITILRPTSGARIATTTTRPTTTTTMGCGVRGGFEGRQVRLKVEQALISALNLHFGLDSKCPTTPVTLAA